MSMMTNSRPEIKPFSSPFMEWVKEQAELYRAIGTLEADLVADEIDGLAKEIGILHAQDAEQVWERRAAMMQGCQLDRSPIHTYDDSHGCSFGPNEE